MAKMIDKKPEFYGEGLVWENIKKLLSDDIISYNNREVQGREFDQCLLIKNKGILIIEIKGWKPDEITVNSKDDIYVSSFDRSFISPKSQANAYRFKLKEKIEMNYQFTPLVMSMACYPLISRQQFYQKRLDIASEIEYTLVKEDFESETALFSKITNVFDQNAYLPHVDFNSERLNTVRLMWEPAIKDENGLKRKYSNLTVFNHSVNNEEIDNLIGNYKIGVKQIVFVKTQSDVEKIRNALNDFLRIKNISAEKGNLFIGYKDVLKGEVNIFNFQVFVSKLDLPITDKLQIENGKDEGKEDILTKLSECTAFNYNQYKVEHAPTNKHILVEAGAGTGKTYSMVSRVAYLCNNEEDPLTDISKELGMFTFTNDAANNMKSRLKRMFENYFILTRDKRYLEHIENIDRAAISTIHKFCIETLRNSIYYTGLGTNYSISTNEILRRSIYDKYINEFLNKMLEENSNFINEVPVPIYDLKDKTMELVDKLITKSIEVETIKPEDFGILQRKNLPYFNELLKDVIFKAEKEYLSMMELDNLMDLKECIILLNRILRQNEDLLNKSEIKYLFIDEFQDTDDIQIELFKKIKQSIGKNYSNCRLFIVGDIKQSIYRFRGARLSAFEEIKKLDNLEWCNYTLNTNYRTDKKLLDEYDEHFESFGSRNFLPYTENDKLIGIKSFNYSENLCECVKVHGKDSDFLYEEAIKVIKKQKDQLTEYLNVNPNLSREERTIAVLVRSNWQIVNIVKEAAKRDLIIEVQSGGDLFQLESTHDLYKLIMAVLNYNNPIHLVNFIESNYTDLKLDYLNLYHNDAQEKQVALINVLDEFFRIRMNMSWHEVVTMTMTKPILYSLRKIYESLQPWQNYGSNFSLQRMYMENYEYLLEKIIEFFQIDSLTVVDIAEYLKINILTGRKEISRKSNVDDQNVHVICTTVHKSKGLEYGTVILPFTSEDLTDQRKIKIDANYSKNKLSYYVQFDNGVDEYNSNFNFDEEVSEQISEETRILYVALTRAIFNCVYIHNVDSNPRISWGTLMEDLYVD